MAYLLCDQCGKNLNALDRRMKCQHLKTHLEDFVDCNECGKEFMNIRLLKKHMANVHYGVDFNCDECGQTFQQKASLGRHIASKHEVPSNVP